MPDELPQAQFNGWARVEVMGHQTHIGYVRTEAYGAAVLFRVDTPELPEREYVLESPEWSEDSNIAWKWINGRDCSYSYCWHVGVVTNTGCPSGVYVEVNILDSGDNVIDYSNGTLSSLGPSQTGIIEISNSYSATGQISKISCHRY